MGWAGMDTGYVLNWWKGDVLAGSPFSIVFCSGIRHCVEVAAVTSFRL